MRRLCVEYYRGGIPARAFAMSAFGARVIMTCDCRTKKRPRSCRNRGLRAVSESECGFGRLDFAAVAELVVPARPQSANPSA